LKMNYEVHNTDRQSFSGHTTAKFSAKSDRGAKTIFHRHYPPIIGFNMNRKLYRVAKNGRRVFVEST